MQDVAQMLLVSVQRADGAGFAESTTAEVVREAPDPVPTVEES